MELEKKEQKLPQLNLDLNINPDVMVSLDLKLFTEIKEYERKVEVLRAEERRDRKKNEKLHKYISDAQEMIAKGEEKKRVLLKRGELLQRNLDNNQERMSKSLEYWKDYGFDVRQLSTGQDNFKHYEFIYTKIGKFRKPSHIGVEGDTAEESKFIVGIKVHDGQLQIVSLEPSNIFSEQQTKDLNETLANNCIHDDYIDYKLAMLTIRKNLIKSLASHS